MELYDIVSDLGIQIKCIPNPQLIKYDIGNQIPLEDGLYIGYEGWFIVHYGKVLTYGDKITDKWGNELIIRDILKENNPVLKVVNEVKMRLDQIKAANIYGCNFRVVVGIHEDSHEVYHKEYFIYEPVIVEEKKMGLGWIFNDNISDDFDMFTETFVPDYLKEKLGIGYYEIIGEMYTEYFQCGHPFDPPEWDVDYDIRNERIVTLPEEAIKECFSER